MPVEKEVVTERVRHYREVCQIIVFQIIDDVLDVEGDAAQLGKPVGSDKENNKSTFVSLYGTEKSKEIAREMTARADSRLKAAFGEKADLLIEYTKYLLSRNK